MRSRTEKISIACLLSFIGTLYLFHACKFIFDFYTIGKISHFKSPSLVYREMMFFHGILCHWQLVAIPFFYWAFSSLTIKAIYIYWKKKKKANPPSVTGITHPFTSMSFAFCCWLCLFVSVLCLLILCVAYFLNFCIMQSLNLLFVVSEFVVAFQKHFLPQE